MSSPILEALPALHVTIIGVVAAFFSAFVIYAYQKVNDAKEKLDEALKHSMSVSTPDTMLINSNNVYLNEDGTLNWDEKGKEILRRATMPYSYLDYENDYNLPRSSHRMDPSSEEVLSLCNELCLLLTTIFATYPFMSEISYAHGQTEKVSDQYSKGFDSERVQEMQRIVVYLNFIWSKNNRSLMALARKGVEYSRQKQLEEQAQMYEEHTKMFEDLVAKMPGQMPEHEKQRILSDVCLPQTNVARETDFQDIFVSFFKKAHVLEKEVIPLLSVSISNFNTYNETFRVKETTLKVILLIMFNMFVGVLLPLVTLNLPVGVHIEWSKSGFSLFEYIVLLSTMLPYLWVCKFLFEKVKKLNFS
ncbi:hypothetical protein R7Q10_02560 [Vibrio sp. Vb0599]|uniref:hypothetical protein n=1 Tax=Vibrio sp. Vb0599 TaxID=3074628 RepID=UPI002963D281|nr:hypothetical protein [Vibrio sp. Vb0599]MDW1940880.1 hypothetical protein [Vibrio sp. Vb0599]